MRGVRLQRAIVTRIFMVGGEDEVGFEVGLFLVCEIEWVRLYPNRVRDFELGVGFVRDSEM
jgi:hypothetical protein